MDEYEYTGYDTTVEIEETELSERTKNALIKAGIYTLNELVDCKLDFSRFSGMGVGTVEEIRRTLINSDALFKKYGERQRLKKLRIEEIGELPITCLCLNTRTINALYLSGVRTLGDLLASRQSDFAKLINMGDKCVKELNEAALRLIYEGRAYIDRLYKSYS